MRMLPSLALVAVALPLAVAACTGDDTTTTPGTGGAGGATGGAGGAGGAMGGGAGTATTGGSAGTGGATGGSAGTGTTGGSAGTGGATGGTAGTGTAGTGTAGTGTAGTGSGATDYPADMSQAGLEAFIAAASYKGVDWKSDAEMPSAGTSLHGERRIWYNKTLRTSKAAGNGAAAMPHPAGSMVVKEISTAGTVVGQAVMLRNSNMQWIYYCKASEAGRCSTSSMPNTASYSTTTSSCACHGGGTIITSAMIPAP